MTTEYSHPTARCPVAWTLYKKWVAVAGKRKKYEQPYKGAKAEYQLHAYDVCPVCRGGRDEKVCS